MAISKTTAVQRVEVYPPADSSADTGTSLPWPTLMVVYIDTLDDPDDAELPITANRVKHLSKFSTTVAEDGTESLAATSVTSEDQLIQDICGAVWS